MSHTRPILYSFRRCPYAMRARMALTVSELDYEHREVALRHKPDAMLQASPKGTVPVYITSESTVIDESLAIMAHALNRSDPKQWLRDDTKFTHELIQIMDGDFKYHLDRYKYASRYDETAKRGDVDLDHRARALACLTAWENTLKQTSFLLDEKPSLADIATFPFIRQFAATEPDWWASSPLPNTARWLSALVVSDMFLSIMNKRPLWTETKVINDLN